MNNCGSVFTNTPVLAIHGIKFPTHVKFIFFLIFSLQYYFNFNFDAQNPHLFVAAAMLSC